MSNSKTFILSDNIRKGSLIKKSTSFQDPECEGCISELGIITSIGEEIRTSYISEYKDENGEELKNRYINVLWIKRNKEQLMVLSTILRYTLLKHTIQYEVVSL